MMNGLTGCIRKTMNALFWFFFVFSSILHEFSTIYVKH